MRRLCTCALALVLLVSALAGCSPLDFDSCQDLDVFEGLFSMNNGGMLSGTPAETPFAVDPSRQYTWIGEAPGLVGVSTTQGKMVWSFEVDGKTYHAEYIRVE